MKFRIAIAFAIAGVLMLSAGQAITQSPDPTALEAAPDILAQGPMMGNRQWMRVRMQAMHALPPEFRGLRNPLDPTDGNILTGGKLYQQFCATCHGPKGRGDGPAAQGLNPPPTPLAFTVPMPMTTDGYLFWRIKEGGQTFGTAMPPWGATLKEDQIWQIILYMRAGFPEISLEQPQEEGGKS